MLNHAAMIMMSQPKDMSEWFCVDFTNSTVDGSVTISSATENSFRTNQGTFSAGETIAVPKGSKLFMKGVNTVQSLFTDKVSSNAWKLGGTNIRISGNIQTLLGDEKQDGVGDCAFSFLFYNSPLVDAGELMLPATTLASSCYYYMFGDCTRLTQAPALPATTLASYCYTNMFRDCTKLNYIKCLATDVKHTNTMNWVRGVASGGTFVKNKNESNWPSGYDGIPSGWTVRNA